MPAATCLAVAAHTYSWLGQAHSKCTPTSPIACRPLPPVLFSTLQEQQVKNSLIPGFVKATTAVTLPFFPPPRIPPGYVPAHRPSRGADATVPAAGGLGRAGGGWWLVAVDRR